MMIIDEPYLSGNASVGGWGMVIPYAVVDNVLAKRASELFPDLRRYVRMDMMTHMESYSGGRSNIRFVTGGWSTYGDVRGPLAPWMAQQHAAAARLGLPFMWSINGLLGTNKTDVTAAQVRAWGTVMAADVNSDGLYFYAGIGHPLKQGYLVTRSDMRAAWDIVLAAMVQP
jgi:hypothetical protein